MAKPTTRDEKGDLPFNTSLRAPDDRKPSGSGDSSSKDHQSSNNSRTDGAGQKDKASGSAEVNSPRKNRENLNKRKGGPQQNQVYRRVDHLALAMLLLYQFVPYQNSPKLSGFV